MYGNDGPKVFPTEMIPNVAKANSHVNKRFYFRAIVNLSNNFCFNLYKTKKRRGNNDL